MSDFWRHSGYHLLARGGDGRLAVTDDFLRAYFERPEIAPVAESCAPERKLHAGLMDNPRAAVADETVAALADEDARENYALVLNFRDRLLASHTIEDCYLGLFRGGPAGVPPMFIDQLTQICLRGILEGAEPLQARAGEIFFRPQKVTLSEGGVLAADEETVEMYGASGGFGDLGRLLAATETPLRNVELDVLTQENAATYWQRDERHDTVLDLSFARPGLDALCRVLEAWVLHFTRAETRIHPVASISDEQWVWHVGLDAEATSMLNDLYNGVELDEDRNRRLLGLFRLEFADPSLMERRVAGRPVYLAMAMDQANVMRFKPQNLLVNLPLAPRA